MKTLILGAGGLVGAALARLMPSATKTSHDTLDITRYDDMFRVFSEVRPDVVYLAAAKTNVDACEDRKSGDVNVSATIMTLRLCEMFDSKLVWFSSGYVFNGLSKIPYDELHPTDPIQNYGRQKVAVEDAMVHSGHNILIIRTIGVFGEEQGKKNFVKSVTSSVTSGKKVFAPIDQYMNPILASDLAETTIGLVSRNSYGIYHVAGDETISKYEFAHTVAAYFGKEKMVEGVTSDQMKQRAARPRMGALDCSALSDKGFYAPSFEKGLSRFLDSEYG